MIRKVFYVWFSLTGRINRAKYLYYYSIPMISLVAVMLIIVVSFGTFGPGEEPASVRYILSMEDNGEERVSVRYILSMEDNFVATLVLSLLFFIFLVGATWGYLATGVKRLHDMGFNGWTLLVFLVPILGFVVVFALAFVRGDVGENRFGPIEGA